MDDRGHKTPGDGRPVFHAKRRIRVWALAAMSAIALSGCFPCEGVALAFPDHPLVVRGTWDGVASSGQGPDLTLQLELDVAYVDRRTYDVAGALDIDGGAHFLVLGSGYGFCAQRFEQTALVSRAMPMPEQPRFEATLFDANGAPAGSLLAYRILRTDGDDDTMHGELHLDLVGEQRTYFFDAERR